MAQPFVESLETPLLLVAMPQVLDPNFNRSVVLLLEHSTDGSFGLVINKPLELTVESLAKQLSITWNGLDDSPLFFGGPVYPNVAMMLFGESSAAEKFVEIAPGLRISEEIGTLRALASDPPSRLRIFAGHAGWGSGQLESEIARNDWLLAPLQLDLLF
ncbi:MAG TPA: YqgE/AlgH family protein, partial [Thermoanaerobaculia bacterium]